MSKSKKVPEHKLRQQGGSENLIADAISHVNPARKAAPSAALVWPFSTEDGTPLAWWRLLPPDLLGDAERTMVRTTLNDIAMLRGGDDFAAALRGEAGAAIGVALPLMPITSITLPANIAMTTLLSSALEPNAASALVMAQVIGLTDLGHPYGTALAAAWLDFGRQHSTDPQKFGDAEVVLWSAFRQRRGSGDGKNPLGVAGQGAEDAFR